jgi:hypothetical protein
VNSQLVGQTQTLFQRKLIYMQRKPPKIHSYKLLYIISFQWSGIDENKVIWLAGEWSSFSFLGLSTGIEHDVCRTWYYFDKMQKAKLCFPILPRNSIRKKYNPQSPKANLNSNLVPRVFLVVARELRKTLVKYDEFSKILGDLSHAQ